MFFKRGFILIFTLGLLLPCGAVLAATLTHGGGATAAFAIPITMTQNQAPSFGLVTTGASGRVLRLSTAGVISGAGASSYIKGARVGNYTIYASATRSISISVSGYTRVNNVTPSLARCSYNGGAEGTCNSLTAVTGVPTGATLLLGLSITTNAAHTDGQTAVPTFNIVVAYN